jgi:uncharacterized DUF497 family protein
MVDDETGGLNLRTRVFEWDENKRRINIDKHGIDFLDVTDVFNDPGQYTYRSKHPKHELRYVTIGMMKGKLIAIVSTLRKQRLRIISARFARKHERERYG